jgi:hypothetical protein
MSSSYNHKNIYSFASLQVELSRVGMGIWWECDGFYWGVSSISAFVIEIYLDTVQKVAVYNLSLTIFVVK